MPWKFPWTSGCWRPVIGGSSASVPDETRGDASQTTALSGCRMTRSAGRDTRSEKVSPPKWPGDTPQVLSETGLSRPCAATGAKLSDAIGQRRSLAASRAMTRAVASEGSLWPGPWVVLDPVN